MEGHDYPHLSTKEAPKHTTSAPRSLNTKVNNQHLSTKEEPQHLDTKVKPLYHQGERFLNEAFILTSGIY